MPVLPSAGLNFFNLPKHTLPYNAIEIKVPTQPSHGSPDWKQVLNFEHPSQLISASTCYSISPFSDFSKIEFDCKVCVTQVCGVQAQQPALLGVPRFPVSAPASSATGTGSCPVRMFSFNSKFLISGSLVPCTISSFRSFLFLHIRHFISFYHSILCLLHSSTPSTPFPTASFWAPASTTSGTFPGAAITTSRTGSSHPLCCAFANVSAPRKSNENESTWVNNRTMTHESHEGMKRAGGGKRMGRRLHITYGLLFTSTNYSSNWELTRDFKGVATQTCSALQLLVTFSA